jgi:hypothetical protein
VIGAKFGVVKFSLFLNRGIDCSTSSAHNGRGFWTLFLYRLLANGRAIAIFYLGVIYELNAVYVQLTFVRIALSWLVSALICGFVPSFIAISNNERRTVFGPQNMALRVFGTILVVVALFIQ